MAERIVTVTATIGSGQVVRWFSSYGAAEMSSPLISASRDGVMGHDGGYISPADFEAAWEAFQQYRADRNADLRSLATHDRRSLFGPLSAVSSTPERKPR